MNEYFFWKNSGEGMPADHYGYWTFQWASESAASFLDSLLDQQLEEWTLQRAIDEKPFPALLRFTAFFLAPYWLYALDEMRVGKEFVSAMRRGLSAGIGDLKDSNDIPLSKDSVDTVMNSFRAYLDAERKERLRALSNQAQDAAVETGAIANLLIADLYRQYGGMEADHDDAGDWALRENLLVSKTSIYQMLYGQLELKKAG